MRKLFGLLMVSAMALAACGGKPSGTPVEVVAGPGFTFTPSTLTLKQGESYTLTLNNQDSQLHDLVADHFPAADVVEKGKAHGDHGAHSGLHVAASAKSTGTVTFTPTAAGEYEIYCSVPGHKAGGMVGTLIVQ